MPTRRTTLIAGAAALCAPLAGCGTAVVTQYYRIAPIPGAVDRTVHANIALRPIIIPSYLNQSGLPKPSSRTSFATFDDNQWAGSLTDLLRTSMVQNLAQRLPDATVIGGGGAIDLPDSLIIEINILTFDPDATGQITLEADVSVKPQTSQHRQTRLIHLRSPTNGTTPTQIAAAMSAVWGDFATQIATLLAPGHA
ncbi:PqiC family protein [Acidiphilium sp. PA]|uniref:PqiC family protein n=1 Tax=Acidiphilium sp. PA TaxID=2871705 RepID=UPI002243115E|nr:PqiC family protein [Acidiphilium sp. PA]MCW8305663.1 PqiC family protein [Acidiphilium sp. PA]